MPATTLYHELPAELLPNGDPSRPQYNADLHGEIKLDGITAEEIKSEVMTWRNRLWQNRIFKRNKWDEMWALYRGVDDFSDKEDWQSKIVMPKAWSSVKNATNVIKRLLSAAKEPWRLEGLDKNNIVEQIRADQATQLVKYFLDKANFLQAFTEGLECGFIMGLGVWKLWWGLAPRKKISIQQQMVMGPNGQPQNNKSVVEDEILEGQLFIRAVDPYNFFWLPGSRLTNYTNGQWVGTIEQIEVPKWELMQMADEGLFDKELIKKIPIAKLNPQQEQSQLRFDELPFRASFTGVADTGMVRLTEFYGPITKNGEVIERNAHVIVAGDHMTLLAQKNRLLNGQPPYVGFSPLMLPFRTEGVGLIEMTRDIDHAINRIANLSVDTLVFRLLPVFEVPIDVYENPEDFETGLHPGKIFRRNLAHAGVEGLHPIAFEDISAGTVQVAGLLDRAHQEGALVSEIQQSIPRYRGAVSATEIEVKDQNQQSFFGNMASEIEMNAIEPLVKLAWELIFQFIDTASDDRIAAILGHKAEIIRGMSKAELQEAILGDYKIRATGITQQLEKAEVLQNLVQFMNLVGQNPQAWLPYINQDALLRRIVESFRPAIHDIEDIVADPQIAAAKQAAMHGQDITPDLIRLMPQLIELQQQQQKQAAAEQQQMAEQQNQAKQTQLQEIEVQQEFALRQAEIELERAKAQLAEAKSRAVPT